MFHARLGSQLGGAARRILLYREFAARAFLPRRQCTADTILRGVLRYISAQTILSDNKRVSFFPCSTSLAIMFDIASVCCFASVFWTFLPLPSCSALSAPFRRVPGAQGADSSVR